MTLFKIMMMMIILLLLLLLLLLLIIIIIVIIIIITIITIMISTTIFQNITEKLEKMTYFAFTMLGVLLLPKVFYAIHG